MKQIAFIILIFLALTGCGKNKYNLYSGNEYVQFGALAGTYNASAYELRDTLKNFTFLYGPKDLLIDTVFFDLYTIGSLSPVDRSYKLTQVIVPGANNAVPGKHYRSFDDPGLSPLYKVKADSIHAFVPIVILRDPSLLDETFELRFSLEENENFRIGDKSRAWRRVRISDQLSRPPGWDEFAIRDLWGKYSRVKHEFMIQSTGQKWDDVFMDQLSTTRRSEALFWKGKLKTALADYNFLHPTAPLISEINELVQFP